LQMRKLRTWTPGSAKPLTWVSTRATTGGQNTAIGHAAAYGVTTGNGNVMIGFNLADACITGSNNTFLGENTALAQGQIYLSGPITLGEGVLLLLASLG